jgi:hypothetical protein
MASRCYADQIDQHRAIVSALNSLYFQTAALMWSHKVVRLRVWVQRALRPQPVVRHLVKIKAVIAELPTYDYRRVHAILKRQALAAATNRLITE